MALHACGIAADLVLECCIKQKFVNSICEKEILLLTTLEHILCYPLVAMVQSTITVKFTIPKGNCVPIGKIINIYFTQLDISKGSELSSKYCS